MKDALCLGDEVEAYSLSRHMKRGFCQQRLMESCIYKDIIAAIKAAMFL